MAIRNYFKSENISSFSPIKKPLPKPSHKITRVEAAKEWIKLDEKELECIIFSEESKYNLFYAPKIFFSFARVKKNFSKKSKDRSCNDTVYGLGNL